MQNKTHANILKTIVSLVVILTLLFSMAPSALAAPKSATEITKYCKWATTENSKTFKYAVDKKYKTAWTSAAGSSHYVDFTVNTKKYKVGGIYFRWYTPPKSWELFAKESNGSLTSILKGGTAQYLTDFVSIPSKYAGYKNFRLVMNTSSFGTVGITEISVFAPGSIPYYAPQWKSLPENGRVDLLTIAAHPDDEALYLSVPAVTYANQGKSIATVFMTYGAPSTSLRRFEAQESAWALGNRYYPAMASFPDKKTVTKEEMAKIWGEDETIKYLVEQIRRWKPSVIVTHDVKGEYWHGAHRLTQYATAKAFEYAGDPNKYPESAKKYGTWKAAKLYVHLYKTNAFSTMNLNTKLKAFGNRTVYNTIKDAYSRHKSQLPGRKLPKSGAYDMRKFGLYATNVGLDKTKKDMFENVSFETMLNLNPWYNSVLVDRKALSNALDNANAKSQNEYTPESWAAANLPNVIAKATAVYNDKCSTQAQLDAQVAAINAAIAKLISASSIAITAPPTKQTYMVGEELDLTGLVVTATYSNKTQAQVPISAVSVSGFNSSKPATGQKVTVTYLGKKATFTVDIEAPTLDSIEITKEPLRLEYGIGDEIDLTGLVVTGKYSNGTSAVLPVTLDNITGFDSSEPIEEQAVTITIDGKSATFYVSVVEPGQSKRYTLPVDFAVMLE